MIQDDIANLRKGGIKSRISFLLKDSVFYGLITSITKMLHVILLPILTRYFSKEEYATIDALTVLGFLFFAIFIMGQDSAVARYFYETEDENEKKQIVSQGLFMELVTATVLCLVLYYWSAALMEYYMQSQEYLSTFRILILSVFFRTFVQFWQNLLKWTFARWHYLFLSVGLLVSVLLLTLAFIFLLDLGVEGVFYAYLCSFGLFSFVGLIFCRRYIVLSINGVYLKRLFQFGWPYMLIMVLAALIPAIDRYFINDYFGLEMLAIYAVAYRVAMVLNLPIQGFRMAWAPFAYAIYKEKDASITYDKILSYYTLCIFFILSCFFIVADPVIEIFASDKYATSSMFIYPIAYGIAFNSLGFITGIGLGLAKKPYYFVVSYVIAIGCSIGFILLLINLIGVTGVPVGVMLGHLIFVILKTLFANKIYPIKFSIKRPLTIIAATLIFNGFFYSVAPLYSAYGLYLKILELILLVGLLIILLTTDERRTVLSKFYSLIGK